MNRHKQFTKRTLIESLEKLTVSDDTPVVFYEQGSVYDTPVRLITIEHGRVVLKDRSNREAYHK